MSLFPADNDSPKEGDAHVSIDRVPVCLPFLQTMTASRKAMHTFVLTVSLSLFPANNDCLKEDDAHVSIDAVAACIFAAGDMTGILSVKSDRRWF